MHGATMKITTKNEFEKKKGFIVSAIKKAV
jgi:hypothetical protein